MHTRARPRPPTLALVVLLLLAACSDRTHEVKDTAYWRAKFAKGDSEGLVAEGTAALPTLEALLRDENETVVQTAARAMGEMGLEAAPAVPALLEALGRFPGNPFLAQTLKELKGAAVPGMIEVLKTGGAEQKAAVAKVLAGVGTDGAPALPALIDLLEGSASDAVKEQAIAAAAAISVKAVNGDALPALEALKAKGGELGTYASNAIRRIEHAIEFAAKLAAEEDAGN